MTPVGWNVKFSSKPPHSFWQVVYTESRRIHIEIEAQAAKQDVFSSFAEQLLIEVCLYTDWKRQN